MYESLFEETRKAKKPTIVLGVTAIILVLLLSFGLHYLYLKMAALILKDVLK